MRLSTAKDKVLKSLVTNEPPIQDLKIDRHTITAALVDLANEKYITTIETSVTGSGFVRTFAPQSVLPLGAHFCNTKQSFRRNAIWKFIEDAPKRYWFIIVLITSLGFNVKDIIKYFSESREHAKTEAAKQFPIKDSTKKN
jgi:hypothetical protein